MDLNDESQQLPLLFQKDLNHLTAPNQAAYCDVHDLLALFNASTDEVLVYRAINGQLAFAVKFPDQYEDAKPCVVAWKPDGSLIGVVWDDGSCCLYSGENGKLISRLDVGNEGGDGPGDESEETRVPARLAWTLHRGHSNDTKHTGTALLDGDGSTVETWFRRIETETPDRLGAGDADRLRTGIEGLAHSITTLDVSKVFPGLSALPSHGVRAAPEASKFTTQAGVDAAFQPSSTSASTSVDTLLIVDHSGDAKIFLDDSVKIGRVLLNAHNPLHASHPLCPSQAILAHTPTSTKLSYMSIPLAALGSSVLAVIAQNTKNFQNLSAYITHTVRCIQHDFTTGQQLPARLINTLNSDLQDKNGDDTAVTALYEVLMTARFTPIMTEWLTDIIKDTQRKRWDQAVSEMYEHLQTHLFMHLIPALDRLCMAASSLRGLARMYEGTSTFDVPQGLFTAVIDGANALRMVAEKVQLIVVDEMRQFRAFIKWLKVMVDVASAGPGTKSAVETEGREISGVNVELVERYIRTTMGKSEVRRFVEKSGGDVQEVSRERTVEALKSMNSKPWDGKTVDAATNLPALSSQLDAQTRICLENITDWQQIMLSSHSTPNASDDATIPLEPGSQILDMKMCPSSASNNLDNGVESTIFVLAQPAANQEETSLTLFSVTRTYDEKTQVIPSKLRFDGGTSILDAHLFEQDAFLTLLLNGDGNCYLLYSNISNGSSLSKMKEGRRILHAFSPNSGFRPSRFLIGGREGKKIVVVFSEDGKGWMVLDLEAAKRGALQGDHRAGGDIEMFS